MANAERRKQRALAEVEKVNGELKELNRKLLEAQQEEKQLPLPFETRTRGLSEKWASVLNFMVLRSPHPVSIDEILQFAAENDLDISRASVRAQLYNYAQRGLIERLDDGLYLTTSMARAYCDY